LKPTSIKNITATLTAAEIPAAEAVFEARALICHALGITRTHLFLREETAFIEHEWAQIAPLLTRRVTREPLAYILGTRGFFGLEFRVTPAVLIPRPETELLVEMAISHATQNATIADIGTGSGCIAVSIAKNRPDLMVFATDVSSEALEIAKENAENNGVNNICFCQGDLCDALPTSTKCHIILSNPPYISPEEITNLQPEVRDFEPHLALGTHPNPLLIYEMLATQAKEKLLLGGLLAVEVGQGQAESVAQIFTARGYTGVTITNDYAGIGRVVSGFKSRFMSGCTIEP
jgi:release factor glutamine methyltransferase